MAKRKNHSKRSLGTLPKGLPHKAATAASGKKHSVSNCSSSSSSANPFEYASGRNKSPKHAVHNRQISNLRKIQPKSQPMIKRRSQHLLQEALQRSKKANSFVDRRIGEYDQTMSVQEQNLARLVRERTRRSKKTIKFNLNDDHDNYDSQGMLLTHKGQVINDEIAEKSILFDDDDDDDDNDRGNLDAMDTALHFGGMTSSTKSPYGPSSSSVAAGDASLAQNYSQRKTELDDLIMRRKLIKAERVKNREQQEDVIANLDGAFQELSSMLNFRDKEQEIRKHIHNKRQGNLDPDEKEMEEWNQEIRQFSCLGKRAKATDRTKTPEEIAKEEAQRLHKLETRRLARMNGDFSDDDFSDLSDEEGNKRRKKRKKTTNNINSDHIESSGDDNDDEEELTAKFTPDGLVYVNKQGKVVKKLQDETETADEHQEGKDDRSDNNSIKADEQEHGTNNAPLKVGTRVKGNYRATEQHEERDHWYDGVIAKVNHLEDGVFTYDVDYDDGDFEKDMEPENVRPAEKSKEELQAENEKEEKEQLLKRKRDKARQKARQEIPFVFEVPTTLEALHAIIGKYATTGEDASLIIQRVHAANSVKLDRRNAEKMQNYYDVLLRRFIAVGDAIYTSGDGSQELGRYQQLDAVTKVLFQMTQDSPECASAVWARRLGIFENAHAKRLRDSEFERDAANADSEALSAWPSVGTVLLFRVVGHLFPVTDRRHNIVTPLLLFLGQMLSQTPVESTYDVLVGTMIAGMVVEYAREAKRVVPEAIGFLSGIIRLFASDPEEVVSSRHPLPSLESAACLPAIMELRQLATTYKEKSLQMLRLEKSHLSNSASAAASILTAALHFAEAYAKALNGALEMAERDAFAGIACSLLCLNPNGSTAPLPKSLQLKIASAASAVGDTCKMDEIREPLKRRSTPKANETTNKSLAPRMEDPDRYSRSKDKGKSALQVAADRTRREYKREHKAVARELRLDAAFIEEQRRKETETKTKRARAERQKNFAWLEGEQAAMNLQVKLGGGLLRGGGMGAAKAKAKSGKLGIKKGGKF